jgi:hypothetical protein
MIWYFVIGIVALLIPFVLEMNKDNNELNVQTLDKKGIICIVCIIFDRNNKLMVDGKEEMAEFAKKTGSVVS